MSLERNHLARKLKLARKEVREKQTVYDVLQHQTKAALTALLDASSALYTLEAQARAALQMEEDLAGKRGPLVQLSKGTCTLEHVFSSEPWPGSAREVKIRLNPLGDPNRSFNLRMREEGRQLGDVFTDDDVAEVLLALPKIEGGEKAVAFFMSWGKA